MILANRNLKSLGLDKTYNRDRYLPRLTVKLQVIAITMNTNQPQSDEVSPDNQPVSLALTSVRDIEICRKLVAEASITADLHGIVTWRTDAAKHDFVFFRLHDGTGSIQGAARNPPLDNAQIALCQLIKPYDRINAKGQVTVLRNKRSGEDVLTLLLDQTPTRRTDQLDEHSTLDSIEPEVSNIGTQIFLARLRERSVKFFRSKDFLELEPRMISSSWTQGGLSPLRILFPGFGVPAYLAPSPRTQLLKAIILTGKQRVFAVSRCFTSAYRDRIVSAESPLLCAQWLNVSIEQLYGLAEEAVRYTFGDISTAPNEPSNFVGHWRQSCMNWPPTPSELRVDRPEIHTFLEFKNDPDLIGGTTGIFRLCYPPNVVLAEGAIEKLDGDITVGTLSLHFERMVELIRSGQRQLRDLGPMGRSSRSIEQ